MDRKTGGDKTRPYASGGVVARFILASRSCRCEELGLRRDFLQRQVKLFLFLIGREQFLQQHYLSFGLEFSQSFAAFGLGQAGGPFPTSLRARVIYGAAGFPICIPGQEDAAFLGMLEQVAFLYRHLHSILRDALWA